MHILLNVAQATGIQENSYGWRPGFDEFMFTLIMGLEILLGTYRSSSVGTGTSHACTSGTVEHGAAEAAGWRTRGDGMMGVCGGAVLSFPR